MPLQKVPHSSNILQTCNLQPTAKELSIFQFGPPPIICQRETNGCDIYMDLHICPTREGVEQLKHHYLQLDNKCHAGWHSLFTIHYSNTVLPNMEVNWFNFIFIFIRNLTITAMQAGIPFFTIHFSSSISKYPQILRWINSVSFCGRVSGCVGGLRI